MKKVTVSSRCQIVIPEEIREQMGIKPGQEMGLFQCGELIALVPDRPISEARGMLKGIDTTIEHEPDRF